MGASCSARNGDRQAVTAVSVQGTGPEKSPKPPEGLPEANIKLDEALLNGFNMQGSDEDLGTDPVNVKLQNKPLYTTTFERQPDEPAPTTKRVFLTFQGFDGEIQHLGFKSKPMGLYFKAQVPLKVKSVVTDSLGEEKGVLPGWILTSINGTAVGTNFPESYQVLKEALEKLPGSQP